MPTLEPESEDDGLGYSVTLSPAPQVLAGSVLRATITAYNDSATAQTNSVVILRSDYTQLTFERAEGDRILMIAQGGNTTQVLFRSIGPGETVTGTVLYRLREGLAQGTAVAVTPEYFCGSDLCLGNRAEVQVSAAQVGQAGARAASDLLVAPASGGADTIFRFSSNRYNRRDVVKVFCFSQDGSKTIHLPHEYRIGDDVLVVVAQGDLPLASVRTRADGVYLIPVGLSTGTYTVRALAASAGGALGYQDATFAQPVAVTSPQLRSGINFALARGGASSGV